MFVHNVALVFVTCVLLVAGGHQYWRLRRRVYEARSIGRYRLRQKIGSGGMGEVWRAWHPALNREIAVKILKPNETSAAAIARFEREVRATTELQHPNTVRVFDCGVTDDGLWFYAMELLQGQTLAEMARGKGIEPERAVHIVRQATRAIAEAHGRGIVHRDVKPENLFVTSLGGERDFVKVLDFGIAKLRDGDERDGETLTREGAMIGTPMFMSPEQASGTTVDPRSDVYSLGAVLYFALTGRPPFDGPNATSVLLGHMSIIPKAPSERAPRTVPPSLDAVVLRCLEKDPSKRYASAADLDAALAECV
jgi:serine/threonine-protein kinase